jgi:hypothetical protein
MVRIALNRGGGFKPLPQNRSDAQTCGCELGATVSHGTRFRHAFQPTAALRQALKDLPTVTGEAMGGGARHAPLFAANKGGARHPFRVSAMRRRRVSLTVRPGRQSMRCDLRDPLSLLRCLRDPFASSRLRPCDAAMPLRAPLCGSVPLWFQPERSGKKRTTPGREFAGGGAGTTTRT